jgi:hypothetical protein
MFWQFYLRMGLVYVPTTGVVQRGFYRIIEPVTVVPISNQDAARHALSEAIARGNPSVAAPNPSDRSPPFLTRYAGVKSWGAFVRNASLWGIDEREGKFEILAYRRDPPNGWTHDKSLDEAFAAGTTADEIIERMIAIMQKAATDRSR